MMVVPLKYKDNLSNIQTKCWPLAVMHIKSMGSANENYSMTKIF
jgi:hypothetical protein